MLHLMLPKGKPAKRRNLGADGTTRCLHDDKAISIICCPQRKMIMWEIWESLLKKILKFPNNNSRALS